MYTSFYKLRGRPFQLTPDHRFFYEGSPHRKAIAYLTYGLSQREGFVVITGEVGAGKTILVDYLFSKLHEENFITGKVVTTQLSADNLLRMVADAFGIESETTDKATVLKKLTSFLIGAHQRNTRPLLIIDEVQNLSKAALEELRMLSNYQLRELPLLQTFLVGQPQFRETMASGGLEQLGQRIIASHHLRPLDAKETRHYVEHRLGHVGWQNDPRITNAAFALVFAETGGVPRRINLLLDRLLLFGFLEEIHEIDEAVVEEVLRDMRSEGLPIVLDRPQGAHIADPWPTTQLEPAHAASTEEPDPRDTDIEALSARIAELEQLLKEQAG